jgi:hypothetical protein
VGCSASGRRRRRRRRGKKKKKNRVQDWAIAKTVMGLRLPQETTNFLTGWAPTCFWKTSLYGVTRESTKEGMLTVTHPTYNGWYFTSKSFLSLSHQLPPPTDSISTSLCLFCCLNCVACYFVKTAMNLKFWRRECKVT